MGLRERLLTSLRRRMQVAGDTDVAVNAKMGSIYIIMFGWVGGVICLLSTMRHYSAYMFGLGLGGIIYWSAVFLRLWSTRSLTPVLQGAIMIAAVLHIAATDIASIPFYARTWPLFVLVLKSMHLFRMPQWTIDGMFAVIALFIVLVELDMTIRFGLIDPPGVWSDEIRRELICSCTSPPCARQNFSGLVYFIFPPVFVMLCDSVLTKSTIASLKAEQDKLKNAVIAAQQSAHRLATYDLDGAEAYLTSSNNLPREMQKSLHTLLVNLALYRPYLPQSVLPAPADDNSDSSTPWQSDDDTLSQGTEGSHATAAASEALTSPALVRHMSRHDGWMGDQREPRDTNARQSMAALNIRHTYLTVKVISLLRAVMNLDAFHDAFVLRHESMLSHIMKSVSAHRGVLDTFVGDEFHASFNAAGRPTPRHAASALSALKDIVSAAADADGVNAYRVAIAAGRAQVGVLGTPAFRRPSIVGHVVRTISRLDRFAMATGLRMVCNDGVYKEASLEHRMRIIFAKLLFYDCPLGTVDTATLVYEVIHEVAASQTTTDDGPREWMYELENAVGKEWELHNEAGRLLLRQGAQAGLAYLEDVNAEQHDLDRYRKALKQAQVMHFKPHSIMMMEDDNPQVLDADDPHMEQRISVHSTMASSIGV